MNYKYIIGGVLLIAVSLLMFGLASGQTSLQDEHRPDYVDCSFNESQLEKYQPELQTSHLDSQPSTMYASYCTSAESEYDIAMYWAYYPVQDGFSSEDSHRLDREPIYVFVNDSGGVEKISYSGYHYIKAVDSEPSLNNTHAQAYVVSPHHHYVSQSSSGGEFVDMRSFESVQDDWYANSWSANPEVTYNPYAIESHSSWWSEDSKLDYRASEWYWELQLWIDSIIGSPNTDIDS